jgi:hypothetical protein
MSKDIATMTVDGPTGWRRSRSGSIRRYGYGAVCAAHPSHPQEGIYHFEVPALVELAARGEHDRNGRRDTKAIGYLDLLLVYFPCAAVHLAKGEARNGRWYGNIAADSSEILDWREQHIHYSYMIHISAVPMSRGPGVQ